MHASERPQQQSLDDAVIHGSRTVILKIEVSSRENVNVQGDLDSSLFEVGIVYRFSTLCIKITPGGRGTMTGEVNVS